MEQYYELLGVALNASRDDITRAYHHQRERYSPERLTELDPEFRAIAETRLQELEQAYQALLTHTQSPAAALAQAKPKPGVTRRELGMAFGGAIVGLVIIGLVWFFAARPAETALPPLTAINRPAADFTLETTDGQSLKLSDYRGKVVMLNFWFTTCPPCKEETPALQEAYRRLSDQGLVIIGVNVRANERGGSDGDNDVRRFLEDYGVTYTNVFDREGIVGRDYQVYVLPTTFFIDRDGAIRYARFSTVTTDEVERVFRQLSQETATGSIMTR
jgi:peroxiredoxin